MATYTPAFETQRDEGAPLPWTNCNPASAAMLVDLWTYGVVDTSDVEIRKVSSVPLNQGMNFKQISAALVKLYPELGNLLYSEQDGSGNKSITWGQLLRHLSTGGGAVACGNYGAAGISNSNGLGDFRSTTGLLLKRWQPSGTFGHAIHVCDYRPKSEGGDGTYLHQDPLGHGDYQGDRAPIEALWSFIWKTGFNDSTVRVTAAHGFTVPRPLPRLYSDVDPNKNIHADDIEEANKRGLMSGVGNGRFGSGQALIRDQAATLLIRLDDKQNQRANLLEARIRALESAIEKMQGEPA